MLNCNQKTILCNVEETMCLFYDFLISVLFHLKKDTSSSSSLSMLWPGKGTNEVEGTLTSISSEVEVVVFSVS